MSNLNLTLFPTAFYAILLIRIHSRQSIDLHVQWTLFARSVNLANVFINLKWPVRGDQLIIMPYYSKYMACFNQMTAITIYSIGIDGDLFLAAK